MSKIDKRLLPREIKAFLHNDQFIKGSSKRQYTYKIMTFVEFLQDLGINITRFDRNVVNDFIEHLKGKGLSKSYTNSFLIVIKKYAEFLKEELDFELKRDRLQAREFDKIFKTRIKIPKTQDTRDALTDAQIAEINNQIMNPVYRGMILGLGLCCGLRREEYTLIKISSIDLQRKRVLILGKGDKERFVPILNHQHEQELRNLLSWRETLFCDLEYIFPTRYRSDWRQANPDSIGKRFNSISKTLSFNFTAHQLRYTYGTKLWDHGVDIKLIQEFLGHESIEDTINYLRIKERKIEQKFRKAAKGLKMF